MSELTPQQQFEEKLKDRIRRDIGELMPDEALSTMVQACVDKVFNEVVEIKDYYGKVTGYKKNWLQEEILKLLTPRMNELIKEHLEKNKEAISKAVSDEISSSGPRILSDYLISVLTMNMQQQRWSIEANLESRLRNALQR